MPVLYLDRRFYLSEDGDQAAVICEPRTGVSKGWCARIAPDPGKLLGLWRRDSLDGALEQPWGQGHAAVRIYRRLESGIYEAHRTFRSRRAISAYLEVTAAGGIAILGTSGDEDVVIARLNGMTPHELQAARAVAPGTGGLPMLTGTVKQVALADVEDEIEEDGVPRRVKGYWFKAHRQNARPVNFGVPGGLSAEALVGYARNTYRVDMTLEQRTRLISEVYPELNEVDGYLADDTMAVLARNLKAREEDCWEAFDRSGRKERFTARGVENLVRGRRARADGTPYNEGWVRGVWQAPDDLNRNGDPRLVELLGARQAGDELHGLLFRRDVVTLTGRVRGKADYNQSRNTPFQSLAADGALLALWESLYRGFEPVGFVHDEILYRLPDRGGATPTWPRSSGFVRSCAAG
jgi:hypothetical protein